MTTLRESMVVLSRVTNGTYEEIRAIEEWCEERPPTAGADYPAAAVELGKAGVPTDRLIDCLDAIKHDQQSRDFDILGSAEILAHGLAMFGWQEPTTPRMILSLAHRVIDVDRRPR
jgi:hypothetical protein